jgi:hypothetical protein
MIFTPLTAFVLAHVLALALALTACGGDDGIDMSDPKAVAQAWRETDYGCGEEGVGRAYDLEIHKPGDPSREKRLRDERRDGCKPQRLPEFRVAAGEREDVAIVRLSHSDEPESYNEPETIVLIRDGDEWKVDPDRSEL